MTDTPLAPEDELINPVVDTRAAACPVPILGGLAAGSCPVDHDATGVVDDVESTDEQQDSAARMFSTSVMISGIRCTLAYVVFPWILPIFGLADWLGPWVGIAISLIAIGFNVASIRRFWRADHPWKWPVSSINVAVICLLTVLLVQDLIAVFAG